MAFGKVAVWLLLLVVGVNIDVLFLHIINIYIDTGRDNNGRVGLNYYDARTKG